SEMVILSDHNVVHVERQTFHAILGDNDRRVRPKRVTHTQFVERIVVGGGEIGDNDISFQKLFVHPNINHAGVNDVVGADAFQVSVFNCGRDDVAIGLIEVERAA